MINIVNIDIHIESKEGQTAFDVALEKFGIGHPVTEVFLESGRYDDFEYADEYKEAVEEARVRKVEEARLLEEKRLEQEARIAEKARLLEEKRLEQVSRIAKEKRLSELAEQESLVKEEKLRKLFREPPTIAMEEGDHDDEGEDNEDEVELRRKRLDALLGRDEL